MKKIGIILATICILIGTFMYTLHDASGEVMSTGVLEISLKDVSLSSLAGDFPISEDLEKQFDEVKQSIVDDPELQEMVEKYSENILHAIATGEGTVPNIDTDLKELLNSHSDLLQDALPIPLTKEQEEAVIDMLFENVDFQPVYDQAIQLANEQLPSSAKPAISMASWINSSIAFVVAIILVIVGLAVLVIIHRKNHKWLLYSSVAFLSSTILLYLTSFIVQNVASNFDEYSMGIREAITIIISSVVTAIQSDAIVIGIIGAALCLVYFIVNKVVSKRNTIIE